MSLVVALVIIVVLLALGARYGADSRSGPDPTGRDAAWTGAARRPHTPRRDAAVLARLARLWAAQVRAHELFDAGLRPWEARSDEPVAQTPVRSDETLRLVGRRSATSRWARAGGP